MKRNEKKSGINKLLIISTILSFFIGVVFSFVFFKQTEIQYVYLNQTQQPQEIPKLPEKPEESLPENRTYNLKTEFFSTYPYIGRGETVKFYGSVKDEKNNPIGPVNVIIKVFSPRGKLVNNVTISSYINGTFEYVYVVPLTLTELGEYTITAQSHINERWSNITSIIIKVR